jgi:hypothetical protein
MTDRETYAAVRAESAELLHYSLDDLTPIQSMRLDLITSLRFGLDAVQAEIITGTRVDLAKLLAVSETLAKLLPALAEGPPAPAPRSDDDRDDTIRELDRLLSGIREAQTVEEREELVSAHAQIDKLEAEVARLKAEAEATAAPRLLPAPAAAPQQPAPSSIPEHRPEGFRIGPDRSPWRPFVGARPSDPPGGYAPRLPPETGGW